MTSPAAPLCPHKKLGKASVRCWEGRELGRRARRGSGLAAPAGERRGLSPSWGHSGTSSGAGAPGFTLGKGLSALEEALQGEELVKLVSA